MSDRINCDCGHCSYTVNICTVCDQTICTVCSNNIINLERTNNICILCIKHRISINNFCNFIEENVNVLKYLQNDKIKFYKYKHYLEFLQNIYNHIISYNSIIYDNEIYNYLCDPELIYSLIKKSSKDLYYILINYDNFIHDE
jgi:hypothetical protein